MRPTATRIPVSDLPSESRVRDDASREFLLRLLHTSERPDARIGELATRVDWSRVLERARVPLQPYLAHRIQAILEPTTLPQEYWTVLQRAIRVSTLAHLQRHAALRRLFGVLGEAGISVVVLKGAALSYLVYPRPELRPMGDVDLWVRHEELDLATETLISGGFRYSRGTHRGIQDHRIPTKQLELPDTSVFLEVHGAPQSLERLGPETAQRIWNRAVRARLGDIEATVLSPRDMLLHVSLHLALSNGYTAGLLPLVDIGLLTRRWQSELSWTEMASDYQGLGIDTWMYLTLKLARDIVGAPVPPEFFDALRTPDRLQEMETLAAELILESRSKLPRALSEALTAHSWRERGRRVWSRLFNFYRRKPSERSPGTMADRWETGRWIIHDLRTKISRYIRAWRRGELRGSEFAHRKRLAEGRRRIGELVAESDARGDAPTERSQATRA